MQWILLRGLARESGHWHDFPARLQAGLPEHHRVLAIDLPGTGRHYREKSPNSISGIRQWLQRHYWHLPRPLGLVGLSMGGMVALDWAQHAPIGEVQRLVLINTSTGWDLPWKRMRPAHWPQILRLLASRDEETREQTILRLSTSRPEINPAVLQRWYSIQRQRPVSRANVLRQLRAAATFRPGPSRPLMEGLLLASQGDGLVRWQCSQSLARRWQWPLYLHPDAGHDLALDAPQWLSGHIVAHATNPRFQ